MEIVFISYPKSGRTWMRYVFHLLECPVKFTHAGHGTLTINNRGGKPFSGLKLSVLGKKNIFLYRNPLDTAVSMYFQIHKHDPIKLSARSALSYLWMALTRGLPPKDINSFVLHPVWGVENICRFNRAWLDYFENRPNSLVITYEEARKNFATVVQQLVSFAGIAAGDVEAIVRQSDFEAMKQLEMKGKSRELRLYGLRSGDPNTMKVRKGVVGGYLDDLDVKTIEAAREIAARYRFEI